MVGPVALQPKCYLESMIVWSIEHTAKRANDLKHAGDAGPATSEYAGAKAKEAAGPAGAAAKEREFLSD